MLYATTLSNLVIYGAQNELRWGPPWWQSLKTTVVMQFSKIWLTYLALFCIGKERAYGETNSASASFGNYTCTKDLKDQFGFSLFMRAKIFTLKQLDKLFCLGLQNNFEGLIKVVRLQLQFRFVRRK